MAKTPAASNVPNRRVDEDLAYVTPALIHWAIKRSNLSPETVAEKLNVSVDQIRSWTRQGGSHPSFQKAEALAKLLHVPFGFLYLTRPPEAGLPLPDFRGFDRSYAPSLELLEHLNEILVKQDWYRDYQKDIAAGALKFVGSFTPQSKVAGVATSIRARLGINDKTRESASNWSDYLSILCRRAENVGILVMRSGVVGNLTNRKLRVTELQGFAIADPLAPIVFVNTGDFKAAQVFTFAHEMAHLWIGQSAIANADELDEDNLDTIEEFCNHVAAEVLTPADDYLTAWKGLSASPEIRVQKLARKFWVSTFVTLRRAREFGVVNQSQYDAIKKQERVRRKKDSSGGGDYYRNVVSRMSPRFTDAVLTNIAEGKLELKDAASLLSMKVPTLVKFVERSR